MSVRLLRTAYTIANMERSLGFYQDLLGLNIVRDKVRSGSSYEGIIGIPNVKLRVVLLEDGSTGNLLELVQYLEPEAQGHIPREDEIGSSNLCFVVDDLTAMYHRLRRAGIASRSEPIDFIQEGNLVGRVVTVFDPDRIPVVLLEKRGV
jgi:catechol 2,3-dioxygenase-like lactoylglutathione lyase family enzyme